MNPRTELFVCGLVAACGLLGTAPVARAQNPLVQDVSVSGVAFGDDAGSAHCRVAKGGYYTDFTTTGNAMRVYGCAVRVR